MMFNVLCEWAGHPLHCTHWNREEDLWKIKGLKRCTHTHPECHGLPQICWCRECLNHLIEYIAHQFRWWWALCVWKCLDQTHPDSRPATNTINMRCPAQKIDKQQQSSLLCAISSVVLGENSNTLQYFRKLCFKSTKAPDPGRFFVLKIKNLLTRHIQLAFTWSISTKLIFVRDCLTQTAHNKLP